MNGCVKLASFSIGNYDKGASKFKQVLWFFVNAFFVRASWNPFMGFKILLLKIFGAKIGKGLIIKNNVIIKFPWYLTVGDNCWIGENVWIDNIDKVTICSNVCISQGAMLLTGNHDYTDPKMPYRNAPITIKDGAWIGAKAIVCPGISVGECAILTVGSIATKNLEPFGIYQGTPAQKIRQRVIKL